MLQKIFNEHLWLEDVVFIPEDPYCIIGQLATGDLCEVEAIMAIEEEFGIKIGETDLTPETTMLEFVQLIENRKPKHSEQDGAEQPATAVESKVECFIRPLT